MLELWEVFRNAPQGRQMIAIVAFSSPLWIIGLIGVLELLLRDIEG